MEKKNIYIINNKKFQLYFYIHYGQGVYSMKKLTFFSILVLSFICINCKTNEEDYSKALMCYKNTQNTSSDYINRLEFLSGNNVFSIL